MQYQTNLNDWDWSEIVTEGIKAGSALTNRGSSSSGIGYAPGYVPGSQSGSTDSQALISMIAMLLLVLIAFMFISQIK